MSIRGKIAAVIALALLVAPNAALADNGQNCNGPAAMQDDDCKGKREKPRFQTKFFSE